MFADAGVLVGCCEKEAVPVSEADMLVAPVAGAAVLVAGFDAERALTAAF